jgi:hypothetical protein
MRAATSRRDKENGQSPEERRDALFECIEELTGREFPRNQFPQQSDKYPDEANEAIRSLSDVLGAINSRNREAEHSALVHLTHLVAHRTDLDPHGLELSLQFAFDAPEFGLKCRCTWR